MLHHIGSNKEIVDKICPLSEKSFLELNTVLIRRSFPKSELFAKLKTKNNSEYIVLDGFCRSFLTNPEGDDVTLRFFKANDVISPHITRTKQNVSIINLQALTDIELLEFNAAEFLELMIKNLEIREWANTILKEELMRKTEKEIDLISSTAKERLLKFRKDYAILENLIPHPIIASYLGITNISLSRLRGEIK
ncbi:MAG: Crp/Fnr family transcriptional regulator [Bacteroidia bacterium]|nr:Crp/Fnr family transcriptional regulator [Bacteroidia bacterium]